MNIAGSSVTNIHGRRPGRGVRPLLLLPKVLAVMVYFGGLVAATVLWMTGQPDRQPALIEQFRALFLFVNVPALLLAVVMGLLLFFQHPRVFLRLRWFQVKLGLLVVLVPGGHLFMTWRLAALRRSMESGAADPVIAGHITAGLIVLIGLSATVIALGRLKPRLGQNWARTYKHKRQTDSAGLIVALGAAAIMPGCATTGDSPADPRAATMDMPPDFAVQVFVEGDDRTGDVLSQTSRYVLDAGRMLRLIRGRQARTRTFPPPAHRITPDERQALVEHVRAHQLLAEPTSPRGETPDEPVRYHVSITAWGTTHHYVTTPAESPPTVALVRMLRRMARSGGRS